MLGADQTILFALGVSLAGVAVTVMGVIRHSCTKGGL